MPNSKRLSPEAAADEERQNNPNNNNEGAVGGRRDEASISFRHFLQQQPTDASAARQQQRSARGTQSQPGTQSVDLVDVVALPDFVQDHLVLEDQHGPPSLDISVYNDVLPDFAPSQSRNACLNPGRRRPETQQNTALPDFLSDGPMQCNTLSDNSNINAPQLSPTSGQDESRVPAGRDVWQRRPQLEDELTRCRNERDVLQAALHEANMRATEAERIVRQQQEEILHLRQQLGAISSSSMPVANGPRHENSTNLDSDLVLRIASSSQNLINQLQGQVNELRVAASSSVPSTSSHCNSTNASSDDRGPGKGNITGNSNPDSTSSTRQQSK